MKSPFVVLGYVFKMNPDVVTVCFFSSDAGRVGEKLDFPRVGICQGTVTYSRRVENGRP